MDVIKCVNIVFYLTCFVQCTICAPRKNVLFIIADDLRPELGSYLGPDFAGRIFTQIHTPNLDALAHRSLLLHRAYVQQASGGPSRVSILTGRRPDTTHVYDGDQDYLKTGGNLTTIPGLFKTNGYQTFSFGKIFDTTAQNQAVYDQELWSAPPFHGVANFESLNESWKAVPDTLLQSQPLIDEQITNKVIETLKNLSSSQGNFFMAVGFHKPHLPYVFPASMFQYYPEDQIEVPSDKYAPAGLPPVAWYQCKELTQFADMASLDLSLTGNGTVPELTIKGLRRAYYSSVSYVDNLVGRIVAELASQGLDGNTVIAMLGDHGWSLGEHGEWCSDSNYELSAHTPLMIHIPGVTDAGIDTRQLVEFVDILPTLAEASGLDAVPRCPDPSTGTALCHEGTSLVHLITKPDTALRSAAFTQTPRGTDIMGYSIRTDQYRYTEWVRFTYAPGYTPDFDQVTATELYDHSKDPDENDNRTDDDTYRSTKQNLKRILHVGWRHAVFHNPGQVVG